MFATTIEAGTAQPRSLDHGRDFPATPRDDSFDCRLTTVMVADVYSPSLQTSLDPRELAAGLLDRVLQLPLEGSMRLGNERREGGRDRATPGMPPQDRPDLVHEPRQLLKILRQGVVHTDYELCGGLPEQHGGQLQTGYPAR